MQKVSKAIKKKGYNAHASLNGLATVCMQKGITRYMANWNDGHPSYDHGLKHNTSSANLR